VLLPQRSLDVLPVPALRLLLCHSPHPLGALPARHRRGTKIRVPEREHKRKIGVIKREIASQFVISVLTFEITAKRLWGLN
jgi:hypothetical protein